LRDAGSSRTPSIAPDAAGAPGLRLSNPPRGTEPIRPSASLGDDTHKLTQKASRAAVGLLLRPQIEAAKFS